MVESEDIQMVLTAEEQLPSSNGIFGRILITLTPCFVIYPANVQREVRKVVYPGSRLNTQGRSLAKLYTSREKTGHPLYKQARLFSREEVESLLELSGFDILDYRSTLFQLPRQNVYHHEYSSPDYPKSADFVAIGNRKQETSQQ